MTQHHTTINHGQAVWRWLTVCLAAGLLLSLAVAPPASVQAADAQETSDRALGTLTITFKDKTSGATLDQMTSVGQATVQGALGVAWRDEAQGQFTAPFIANVTALLPDGY
ncbi:hypothetical protein [Lacticaseibacillus absianus]|uniref:hypothetical protein n=1 Tax=Lacticaseibacillus absianus TaxID=2729623 RepID=UPI0015CB273A|nr:hypothetical protein [Lacticaseibacillus absianus]